MYEKNLEFIDNLELKKRLAKITLATSSRKISYCMSHSNDYILLKDDVPMDDLNNPREAIKETLKSTIKQPMDSNDIIITFGLGLGYLLDEVYNTYPSRIFVYEPDLEVLHFVLNNVDFSEILKSGRVFITNEINELTRKLSNSYITKDKVEVVYLKNYGIVKNQELLELTQKVYETCKTKMVDISTIEKFSRKWMENTLKNISVVNNSTVYKLSDLEDAFDGKIALILAAGPSLNENIEKIKANRDKYVIFAVNKVLRVLNSNGIVPDFAVCLDASYIDNTLNGLEDYLSKINCICDLKSDENIFKKSFKKIFVTFSENDFIVKKLANYNDFVKTYEFGGSATTMALVCAVKLGFSKIVFSGLDLAFKDDVVYSTGEIIKSVSDNKIIVDSVEKELVSVNSVTGGFVKTRDDYATFIKHFEVLIRELGAKELYNTTSFGATIKGMNNVAFDELPFVTPFTGIQFVLDSVSPFKFEIKEWAQEELFLINNVIMLLSKNTFSPALVSAIVKSSLLYEYMQADVLKVLQSKFSNDLAEGFIENTKASIKVVVESLQKNRLI